MRGSESEAGGGAPTRESPGSGGGTSAGKRGQVRQSVRRSPERAGSAGRTCIRRTRRPCGLGHDSAAGPFSHVGSPGLGVGGALRTQETRNSGSGEAASGGAGKSRADAQPRREAGPLNNRQESSVKLPMALGHLCVRVRPFAFEKLILPDLNPPENRMKLELICFQKQYVLFCDCGYVAVTTLRKSFQTTLLKCQQEISLKTLKILNIN
ncbi:hypothetical protein NN561_007805 [Cricetulus griseus]